MADGRRCLDHDCNLDGDDMIPLWLKLATVLAVAGGLLTVGFTEGARYKDNAWQARWSARDASDARANADRAKAAIPVIAKEGDDYAKAVATPPVDPPHVWVCPHAPAAASDVRRAPAAGPAPDAPAHVPDPAPRDIGPAIVTVGADADAQVKGLQDYIRDVCLK